MAALRRALKLTATLLTGALLALAAQLFWAAAGAPRPEPWHRIRPRSELTAAGAGRVPDLAAYLRLEDRLFAEVSATLRRRVRRFPAFSRSGLSLP
jgi:hypothetical protein